MTETAAPYLHRLGDPGPTDEQLIEPSTRGQWSCWVRLFGRL